MSRVIELKEIRDAYSAGIAPAQLAREPVILEQNGEPVGAVISIADFRLYSAWKEQLTLSQLPPQFLQDRAAFRRMLPDLLKTHRGQWIAVFKGQVVERANNPGELAKQVYARFGYQAIYMDEVREEPRVYRIPSPRLVR
ncbi:MAG: hypothetical protein HY782_20395 [Chloroflexi bacterium]|nr:hypothetical protein [Chloroflexota bacterium]